MWVCHSHHARPHGVLKMKTSPISGNAFTQCVGATTIFKCRHTLERHPVPKKKRLLEHETFFLHLSAISFAIPIYR